MLLRSEGLGRCYSGVRGWGDATQEWGVRAMLLRSEGLGRCYSGVRG